MTIIGIMFLVLATASLVWRPRVFPYLLAASVAVPHTAAIVVGDNGLSIFHMLAGIAIIRLCYMSLKARAAGEPWLPNPNSRWAAYAALIFVAYAVLISLFGPLLFNGIEVFAPRVGLDEQVTAISTLEWTISNLAQPLYVLLGFGVVLYLGVEKAVSPRIVDATVFTGVGLALIRGIAPGWWPVGLFENMPNVSYAVTQSGLRGSFSEPSLFGMFLVAALTYTAVSSLVHVGRRRILMLATTVVIAVEMAFNLSWTMFAALAVVVAASLVVAVTVFVRKLSKQKRAWAIGAIAAIVAVGLIALPFVLEFASQLFAEKLSSDSAHNRGFSNEIALSVLRETWGLGAGLGSNRPSSLFFLLLSCVGLIGTLSFFAMVASTIVGVRARPTLLPAAGALFACVVAQTISAPELSMPLFWLLLGVVFWRVDRARIVPEAALTTEVRSA